MEPDVKKFVKEYNRRIDWNMDILSKFNGKYLDNHEYASNIISEYLSTEKLSEEKYNLDDSKLYFKCENFWELKVPFVDHTFWVHPKEDENTYKKERIELLKNHINDELNMISMKLGELNIKLAELNTLKRYIY